jgi:glycosyltransferase involved in cell wall biosynthesis
VGNVVLEAMASGVPVVVMERGGPRFVAGPGDGASIAKDAGDLIQRTLALVSNRSRRAAMGAAARTAALRRSWIVVFDAVYRVYALAVAMAREPDRMKADSLVRLAEKQPTA